MSLVYRLVAARFLSFPQVGMGKPDRACKIKRIYHECEGKIEKPVPRIAVWHHEVYRVMTNSDLEGQIFHKNNGFFFLLTLFFI